jgi:hypothetical protein
MVAPDRVTRHASKKTTAAAGSPATFGQIAQLAQAARPACSERGVSCQQWIAEVDNALLRSVSPGAILPISAFHGRIHGFILRSHRSTTTRVERRSALCLELAPRAALGWAHVDGRRGAAL